jgi:hypothetical protein
VTPAWPQNRYRCRLCGALLLGHLSQQHPDRVQAYLDRMHTTEDIGTVIVTAYVVVEEDDVR